MTRSTTKTKTMSHTMRRSNEDEYDEGIEEAYYEDEVPEDIGHAADQVEDAFVSYVESRRRMRELALARGFYPVVALPPDVMEKGKGKSSGKGRGKSKGSKGKGKGKGPNNNMRRTPWTRRPASGLRKTTIELFYQHSAWQ